MFATLIPLLVSSGDFPVPTALPPHSWDTVGHKVFIHGCKREGLFNASELQLAAKFPLLTVEKGQGEDLPGYAEDKMNALAAQYHGARPDGWTLFCASFATALPARPPARLERARVPPPSTPADINAKFNWNMYRLSETVKSSPPAVTGGPLWVVNASGQPCLSHGDRTFPQPAAGMLSFNHSNAAMRALWIQEIVNQTTTAAPTAAASANDAAAGRFSGVFVDSADCWAGAKGAANGAKCGVGAAEVAALAAGERLVLTELQAALGPAKLVLAKDGGGDYNDTREVNTLFPSDAYCSSYRADVHSAALAAACAGQIGAAVAAAGRGQAVLMHGEMNSDASAGSAQAQFEYALAAFLIAAGDSSFFGFSDGWYFNGTRWHEEYDRPLGAPRGPATVSGPDNMTYARQFAHADVALDVANHKASIAWGK